MMPTRKATRKLPLRLAYSDAELCVEADGIHATLPANRICLDLSH